jgi:prepilin signal peptidase PulO-like enzyme (type II secretory pathway)
MSNVDAQQLGIAALLALAAWCLGWLSAALTDYLKRQDDLPSTAHGPLVRDAFVQSAAAAVAAAAALQFDVLRAAVVAVLAVPLIQVTVTDFRHRYVYTVVAAIGIVLGIAGGWIAHQGEPLDSLKGALGAFVAFAGLYLLGRLIYRGGEPLARGDVTIAAMVGAQAGACTASALLWGVLLSGLLALGVLVARRSRHTFIPYGPGLCLGGLVSLFRC